MSDDELLTSKFDWDTNNQELEEDLAEKYPTVPDIVDASVRELQSIKGVGASIALDLKKKANKFSKSVKGTSRIEPVTVDRPLLDHTPTRQERLNLEAELKAKEEEEDDNVRFVMREVVVDKFTTLRKRIKVGPATCDECGFDVIETNKLPEWDNLAEIDKSRVVQTLKLHKEKIHSSLATKRVLTGAEMKRTNWNPETMKP